LSNRLNVGIAGYGVVGKRRRQCIECNENLSLIGVCDRSFLGNGVFADGVVYFTNYKDLLKMDLDILIVCVTNDIAAEITLAGLKNGTHVFCEKPPGKNLEDILGVMRYEKAHPELKLMYGFNHRYHDSVKDALDIVRSGRFGQIINMRGVYGKSKLITFNQSDWRTKRDVAGGGVLLDQGIHMVDLMQLFAGEFTEVISFISNSHWGFDVEDNAYAIMRTKNGAVGMLNSSATQWRHTFSLEINLENGSLLLEGILSGSKSYGSETLTVVTVDHLHDNGDPKEQITRYNHDPSWEEEINYFVQQIMTNQKIETGSAIEAFNTLKLVNKIYYSDPEWRSKYSISNPDECHI